MKAVIQRVKQAKVIVDKKLISQINKGFLVFLGIKTTDSQKQVEKLAQKIAKLRIMSDKKGKMNKSLKETQGQILVVSQFTLYADCSKGNRPSFIKAAKPIKAKELYDLFIEKIKNSGIIVKTGVFGVLSAIELINDGPVTIIIDI